MKFPSTERDGFFRQPPPLAPGSIIGVDIDDTVADLTTPWLARYNAHWGDSLSKEELTDWEITRFVKPECGKGIFKFLDPTVYDEVQPVPGALEAVTALRKAGHRILFVTASGLSNMSRKVEWLRDHGFLACRTFMCEDYAAIYDKSLVDVQAFVDDKFETIDRWSTKYGRPAFLIDRPHNRHETLTGSARRAHSWADVLETLL